ncbi:MAG: UDP-glucose/GDP-mannose dehydrogenase family protein, partial [Bacteroidetes bacterium]
MNISIFGLGYVGCVSLGCLAQNGHQVIGVDVVEDKVALINAGKPTIIETDIDRIIAEQRAAGRISATTNFREAVLATEVSIICVGTPSTAQGHLNLDYIFDTARQIGEAIREKDAFHVVVIRSTVMPGTNERVGNVIAEVSGKARNEGFSVVSNPEFLREGTAVADYYNPAVTVLGTDNEQAAAIVRAIYEELPAPIEQVEVKVAEIIKYVNNSWHALKITFANEVGNICKRIGVDSHPVMELFCKDDRLNISKAYMKPGFAYGGSCLPKDLKGLSTLAHDLYIKTPVLDSIHESNEQQKRLAFEMIARRGQRKVAILGLSFKKGTDDLRYSPMVDLAESLIGKGYQLRIFDRNVKLSHITGTNKAYIDYHIPHLSRLMGEDIDQVVSEADIVVIGHNEKDFLEVIERHP